MRLISTLLLSFTLFSGCAGFSDSASKTMKYAHTAGVGLRETAFPLITAMCNDEISKCEVSGDPSCPGYHKCKNARAKIAKSFVALQFAILDANAALAIGESDSAYEAVGKVLSLLADIRKHLSESGVMTW